METNDLYAGVAKTVRTRRNNVRPLIKQDEMARALNITQSNYSRLEKGEREITLRELSIIAHKLNTTWIQLALDAQEYKGTPRTDVFVEAMVMLILKTEKKGTISYTLDEFNLVASKIKEVFLRKNSDMR